MKPALLSACVPVLICAALSGTASAQDATLIDDAALSGASGRVAVNISAGSGNAQANIAAIGASGEAAGAAAESRQSARRGPSGTASARIDGGAFAGASGIISVNQASGNGNAQANLVALAAGGIAEVSLDQLGSVNAKPQAETAPPEDDSHVRSAVISDSAFAGASGIVQVNQTAGAGNNTANVFALSTAPPH